MMCTFIPNKILQQKNHRSFFFRKFSWIWGSLWPSKNHPPVIVDGFNPIKVLQTWRDWNPKICFFFRKNFSKAFFDTSKDSVFFHVESCFFLGWVVNYPTNFHQDQWSDMTWDVVSDLRSTMHVAMKRCYLRCRWKVWRLFWRECDFVGDIDRICIIYIWMYI